MLPKLARIREGNTDLYVPSASLSRSEPATFPVFFNPAARLNRDVSVAVAGATARRNFLDVLAGVGARGVRIANETKRAQVTMVDFNLDSLAVARKSIKQNKLQERCSALHAEANSYLYSRFDRGEKFDAIDLDPFGSPASYVQSAIGACADGAILSLTATDAAVLCGVYPSVSLRRYGALAVRSEFMHETGLRILTAFAVRTGGILDMGLRPLVSHCTLHYMRVYVVARRGAGRADEAIRRLGYVTQCNGCHNKWTEEGPSVRCPSCGTRVRSAGPLWTGDLVEEQVVHRASVLCTKLGWAEAARTLSACTNLGGLPAFCHSLDETCSRLKVPTVSVEAVMEQLRKNDFRCVRQPFESGIKTDASYEQFAAAVRTAAAVATPREFISSSGEVT